ncbi:hypothetical protein [Vibrio hippocampi]|uniref:Calcium-binding protein n=1 Tax=Vibrio hippocampi TaxID=654686 RepID=A0ABM8ZHM1_9VIBR|nr:hypothetical protein [Vibrio hippocampi]CAH0526197.1 hypothetical protein VHP8226_01671 [Vibrio hippocampi]
MSHLYVGESNRDGEGNASVLKNSAFITHNIDLKNAESYHDFGDFYYFHIPDISVFSLQGQWNMPGYKEIHLELEPLIGQDSTWVEIENFVDVSLECNFEYSDIFIYDAKRGDIITGDGEDSIEIVVHSNTTQQGSWSNLFTIDSGGGDDEIIIPIIDKLQSGYHDMTGSQWTELDIDAGSGDDVVSLLGLKDPQANVSRFIDGGADFDMLTFAGVDSVDFVNFEVVSGVSKEPSVEHPSSLLTASELRLTEELLSANYENNQLADIGLGLIVSHASLTLAENLLYQEVSLTTQSTDFLEANDFLVSEFTAYDISNDNGDYIGRIIANDLVV